MAYLNQVNLAKIREINLIGDKSTHQNSPDDIGAVVGLET
jgi:hypothetical protein